MLITSGRPASINDKYVETQTGNPIDPLSEIDGIHGEEHTHVGSDLEHANSFSTTPPESLRKCE